VAGDSEVVEGVRLLARAHQSAIWGRQRQLNTLREYYPGALEAFGTDLAHPDALAVLAVAPTPELGRGLSRSKIASALRRAGRQRNVEARAEAIQAALRAESLEAPAAITEADAVIARSALHLIETFGAEIAALEVALSEHFEQHPDAKVVHSLPGLGTVLGARVLGEFGDDRTRFSGPQSRKNYAGTSPITKASGRSRVVLARFARNGAWPTPGTSGPSVRSPARREPAVTTTSSEAAARHTARPSGSWPTAWSASGTSVSNRASLTTRGAPGRPSKTPSLDGFGPWGV
jgi:Transposase IS116/IS110/IS902 family